MKKAPPYPGLIAANGDSSVGTNFVFHTEPFYASNDGTCLRFTDQSIDPEYVLFVLHGMKETYGFNHAFKATKENLAKVSITVPLIGNNSGEKAKVGSATYDIKLQREMVKEFKAIYEAKQVI